MQFLESKGISVPKRNGDGWLPRKKVGNVIISGETAMKYAPKPNERDVPDSEWQPIATRFQKRAKVLNSAGFAFVAVGTFLQMAAICVST